ncbi:MAG: MlaD family protein [Bdellovibrionota bacterium]
MKVKFNKFERVAGLFVLSAVTGVFITAVSTAIKQGWFEEKLQYQTVFENADGLHAGTVVQMAGLKAGAIDDVELEGDNQIRVKFHILGKFHNRLREDSVALLVRPFIIGDRVLELTVGATGKVLDEGDVVQSQESTDIMTLMSGKKLGSSLGDMTDTLKNLSSVLQAFLNKDRTDSMLRAFDKLDPLFGNLNEMSLEVTKLSKQANHDENLMKVLANVTVLTRELNKVIPALNKENPDLPKHLAIMTRNIAIMSEDVKVLSATMKELGPEMPQTARRAVEALNEVTILVKALQKNYFIKEKVQEVRGEEKQRLPAQSK